MNWKTATKDDTVELLKNNNVNAKDNYEETPLMSALRNNSNKEVIQVLIDAGADVHARYKDGWSLLMWASMNKNKEVIQFLLDNDVDVNARGEDGFTALMVASKITSNPEVIKMLLDNDADVHVRSIHGWTSLMLASWGSRNLEVIQLLLDSGADVNARNDNGGTSLMIASRNNTIEAVELLFAASDKKRVNWKLVWKGAQENDELKGSDIYWRIHKLQYASPSELKLLG